VILLVTSSELRAQKAGETSEAFGDPARARALIAECEAQRKAMESRAREHRAKKEPLEGQQEEARRQAEAAQAASEPLRLQWEVAAQQHREAYARYEAERAACQKEAEACRSALYFGKWYLPWSYPDPCKRQDACEEGLQPLHEAVAKASEEATKREQGYTQAAGEQQRWIAKIQEAQSALASLDPDPSGELKKVASRCARLRQAARMGEIDRGPGEEFRRLAHGGTPKPESGVIGGGPPIPIPQSAPPPAPQPDVPAAWPALPTYGSFYPCFDARGYLFYDPYPCPLPGRHFLAPRWRHYVPGYAPGTPFPCPPGSYRRHGYPYGPCYR
jgi:hypothetical protein